MFKNLKYQLEYRRKLKADKKLYQRYDRAMRKKYKAERKREILRQLKFRLLHPFAQRGMNPDQLLQKELRESLKKERRAERQRWLISFRKNPLKAILQHRNEDERLQLQQLRKVEQKLAFRQRLKDYWVSFKEVLTVPDLRTRMALTALQSIAYYILAFLLLYVIYQLVTILVATSFNIPTIWYYYRVKFPLFVGSALYTRPALIIIFASGPLICLALSFLFLKLFFSRRKRNYGLRLFYLWSFIHGMNFFFGSYLVGFISRTEFIYVTEWIFMSSMFDVEEIIFALISVTVSMIVGRLVTPLFLLTSSTDAIIKSRYRLYFILVVAFLPWMVGVIAFYLLTSPTHYFPLILKTLTPVLFLTPSLFTFNSIRNDIIQIKGVQGRSYFRWSIIILVIALLFFYRVILNFGLTIF